MTNPTADRNLLFGMLALVNDFITRDQLIAAMHAWMLDKDTPLGQLLEEHEALTGEQRQLLDALVKVRLQQHGGDAHKSLAAVSSVDAEVRAELKKIADPDLLLSLAGVSADRRRQLAASADSLAATTDGSSSDPDATQPPLMVTTKEGSRFRIIRPHAKGGLGQVSVAVDEELQREVALKEIQDRHADNSEARARFLLEGEITGKLEHPGIVPVYGLGQYADGRPFYAMRFIKGDSLKEAIEEFHAAEEKPRLESERLLALRKLLGRFLDVCNAIAYAHSRGVLHRDLKPGNIMLGQYGETLVVDWGLAKVLGQQEPESTVPAHAVEVASGSSATPTEMGRAMGTPAYMSPEQAAGRLDQLGPASDVYSLGATLYCLLTGHAPYERNDQGDILDRVQKGDFPRPRQVNATVPPAPEAICLKAMAVRPEDRYPRVRALAEDVERWLADDPVTAWPEPITVRVGRWVRRHRTLISTAAAVLLVAVVGLGAATVLLQAANDDLVAANTAKEAAKELAVMQKTEAEKQKTEAEKQKAVADSQKALAEKQTSLAEQRAAELQESLGKLAKAETKTREQLGQLAILTGFAADDAWEIGKVERARELLDSVPVDLRSWEWRYRQRRFQGGYCTLYGHTSGVRCVAFSPDGQRLASASGELGIPGEIKLWDARTGQELASLRGHTRAITSVAFSPDSQRLASAGWDTTVKLWDARTGQELPTLRGHTGLVLSVAFSPDGQRLASASEDKTVKLWDAKSGQELLTLRGHTESVQSVAFSPDGQRLVSASWDQTVKLWDAKSGQELLTLRGHTSAVHSVAFSPDGQRLASASSDKMVKLWDARSGQELLTLRGHTGAVWGVAFSPDGQRLASASEDKTVKLWDAKSGQELLTLRGHTGAVWGVAFSPDGQRLASSSFDQTVKLWDARSGQELLTLRGPTGEVWSVAFSPDGQRLASSSFDKTVKLWDAKSGQELLTVRGHTSAVHGVAFSPDGQRLASASSDKTVKLWDARNGQQLLTLHGHTQEVHSVAFSPDGQRLASTSRDQTVKLWDAKSGQELLTLRGHTGAVWGVAFSPDGQRLASSSFDKTVKLWDAKSGQELLTVRGHTSAVHGVAFSPDGQRLASASGDQTVKLWDARSGQELLTLPRHISLVVSVAFSPDGQRLASASGDQTVKLWDARSGQELLTLRGHSHPVVSVAFSPDGQRLASAGGNLGQPAEVKLWDARSGQEPLTLRGHTSWVHGVAFSPDGQLLASASDDTTVKLWDARTGQEQASLRGHTSYVHSVAFSPDGLTLFTVDGSRKQIAWDVKSKRQLSKSPKAPPFITAPVAKHPTLPILALAQGNHVSIVDLKLSDAAENAFREGMARFDPHWHQGRAAQSEKDKNWYTAAFHRALQAEHAPDQAANWKSLDASCAKLGDWKLALAACDRALAREPNLGTVYFERAKLRAHYGQFHAATADQLAGLALSARQTKK